MTENVTSAAEIALARHSSAALRDLAATLGSYVPEGGSHHEEWVRRIASVWNEPASAMRLAGGLPEPTRNLLAVIAWGPQNVPIDSRELGRIARTLGYEPHDAIGGAAAFGAIIPVPPPFQDSLSLGARKQIVETGHCENTGFVIWPSLIERLTAPEIGQLTATHAVEGDVRPAMPSDIADWAVRLAALWQAAMITPLRRTQAGTLHKKDRDQILREPVLAEPPSEWPGGPNAWQEWVFEAFVPCALHVGLLSEEPDALRATPLSHWADDSLHLPDRFARAMTATIRPESFGPEQSAETAYPATPWLPSILLADLSNRPENDWTALDALLEDFADLFEKTLIRPQPENHATKQAAADAVMLKTRPRKKPDATPTPARAATVAPALKSWLLGPGCLAGLVETGTAADGTQALRATAQTRFLTGQGPPPPPQPFVEKALFLQPNLEGILYRQAISGQSLPRVASVLRFAGIGPVLQVRLDESWARHMFGAGLAREEAEARLTAMSAVEISRSVLETFRTWAGKSDRVRIHPSLTLLETGSAEDLEALRALATDRGLAAFPIGERLLAIEDADAIPFDALRLLAQQDQAQKPAQCVRPFGDGTLLEVDFTKSDLALDPELARFTRQETESALNSPAESSARYYRIDRQSLTLARQSGVTAAWLDRFFRKRGGEATPPAVALLWQCVSGSAEPIYAPTLSIKRTCVIRTADERTLDGLMSLESTAPLIAARLGPTAAEVEPRDLEELADIARELGVVLKN